MFIGAFMVAASIPFVLSQRVEVPLVAIVLILGLATVLYRAAESELDLMGRWVLGNASQETVSQVLDTLRDPYIVIHDVPQEREGNIDHLVSGPNGVYLIETKSRVYTPQHLRKAKRRAAQRARAVRAARPLRRLPLRHRLRCRRQGGGALLLRPSALTGRHDRAQSNRYEANVSLRPCGATS